MGDRKQDTVINLPDRGLDTRDKTCPPPTRMEGFPRPRRKNLGGGLRIIKAFIDLHVKKPAVIYYDGGLVKASVDSLISVLSDLHVREVYLEPSNISMLRELSELFDVYILRGNYIAEFRRRFNISKSDENDARALYQIYLNDREKFIKYIPRELPRDVDIFIYEKLTKLIVQLKNMEADNEIIKEILRMRRSLSRKICKKYSNILEIFHDVRGLGGVALIHFLMLIPRINSFKSVNSFLRYLGIKSKNGNRRARALLYVMALQVKRMNDNYRMYSITKIQRLLARVIYRRLKESR
jgi:hypothetical protein